MQMTDYVIKDIIHASVTSSSQTVSVLRCTDRADEC